ncbi:N-glycosylase/DNA lyase [Monosporozyma unispora]|nr:8-oxoguanine glycosylase ogg1 [Kazachstania unispora]
MVKFHKISVEQEDLQLKNVLQAGQAFRWIWEDKNDWYMTSMFITGYDKYGIIVLRQKDDGNFIEFGFQHPTWEFQKVEDHLKQYFRLEVDLTSHQDLWKATDPNFKDIPPQGIRILSQEPWETLISFICSSNNNISRITKMCHNLASHFGDDIGTFDDTTFYSFPTSEQLVERATEERLRELGFGYRAKYIIETAKLMLNDRETFNCTTDQDVLIQFAKISNYEKVREMLMRFTGVGPKVADCVCLMGLHLDEVVPVDVHVARFANRDYHIAASKTEIAEIRATYNKLNLPITKKKINPELDFIRTKLIEKWGPFAGWAQGILFSKEVGSVVGATTSGDIKKKKRTFKNEDNDLKSESLAKRALNAPKVEA